jgi:hypothetical protein
MAINFSGNGKRKIVITSGGTITVNNSSFDYKRVSIGVNFFIA